jgi:hypothetical protein
MALLKKLALSKSYLRGNNVEAQYEDELELDTNLILKVEEPPIDDKDGVKDDVKDDNVETLPQKKKRPPSKYNIFMKETIITLNASHPHLLGKERFALAVSMWNEKKKIL